VKFDTPFTATLIVAAICIFIFFLESYNYVGREEFGVRSGVMAEEPWRFLTFEFTHDGVDHLFTNLLGLVLAGFLAFELGIPGSVFIVVFLVAGFLTVMPPLLTSCPYTFVGASAGICGLFGAVAVWFRRYGLPSLIILSLFFFAVTAAPMAEAISGSSTAVIEAFMHSFGLILGAGLALICEGAAPLKVGKIEAPELKLRLRKFDG
jgi:membrane associated rhomboid family serine protease